MSTPHVQKLANQAYEQRRQLADDTLKLQEKLETTRRKFSIARNLRENFGVISAITSAAAFAAGYGIAGIFRR
jgi:hypothetical protein